MRVDWGAHAVRDLERIARADRREAERIDAAVTRFADTGYGDVRKLTGQGNLERLRVGSWRVIFRTADRGDSITVLAVRRRDQAYR